MGSQKFNEIRPHSTRDDLVALRPFMDYIEDPSLLKALLEEKGVTGVYYVEPTDRMTGCTTDKNYKRIHTLDRRRSYHNSN